MVEQCPGCGGIFAPSDGACHAYMLSSAGCFAAFGEVLAAEYGSPDLMDVHRLSVDTYAVQHPGDATDRRAVQSVGLHLARLWVQLENPRPPAETNRVMLDFSRHKATLVALPSPPAFRITVADLVPHAGTARHRDKVVEWSRATWDDWSASHDYIRQWVDRNGRHGNRRR